MYGCDLIWGPARAAEARAEVEYATGLECPCKRGLRCPIVGDGRQQERLIAATITVGPPGQRNVA